MLSDFIVAKLEEIIRIYKAKRLPAKIYFPIGVFSLLLESVNAGLIESFFQIFLKLQRGY
jgi:hypothetical protein